LTQEVDVDVGERHRAVARLLEERRELAEIAPVRVHRMGRGAPFARQELEKSAETFRERRSHETTR
jgi:hypothetical protein